MLPTRSPTSRQAADPPRAPGLGDRNATLEAIGLVCLAGLLFVAMNAMVKALAAEHNQVMIVWARYFFHVLVVALLFPRALIAVLRTERVGMQLGRSILLLLSTVFNFAALVYLPLADVAAIIFTAPLLVALLAWAILRERVSAARWLAISAGFAGALLDHPTRSRQPQQRRAPRAWLRAHLRALPGHYPNGARERARCAPPLW
jgi:hypothetical protein